MWPIMSIGMVTVQIEPGQPSLLMAYSDVTIQLLYDISDWDAN